MPTCWQCVDAAVISKSIDHVPHAHHKAQSMIHAIRVCTFNPSKVHNCEHRAFLAEQFDKHGLSVVGLQECKSSSISSGKPIGAYTRFASPCDHNGRGVELRFRTNSCMGNLGKKQVLFKHADYNTLYSSSRILAISCTTSVGRAVFISAHSIHGGRAKEAKHWWKVLTNVLKNIRESLNGCWPVVLLVDANARPLRQDLHIFGAAIASRPSLLPKDWYGFLEASELWVPNTFEDYLQADTERGTKRWHEDEALVTIDYIAISFDIDVCPNSVGTLFIDMNKQVLDHLAVVGDILLLLEATAMSSARRRPNYDRSLTTCPQRRRIFSDLVAGIKPIRHDVEPTTHVFMLQEQVRVAAETAFPKIYKALEYSSLTASTVGKIHDRCTATSTYYKYTRAITHAVAKRCLRCWFVCVRGACALAWPATCSAKHLSEVLLWDSVPGLIPKRLCLGQVFARATMTSLAAQCKSLVKLEVLADVQKTGDRLDHLFMLQDTGARHKVIQRYTPTDHTHRTYISNSDGTRATNISEHKHNLKTYMTRLMSASERPFESHVRSFRHDIQSGRFVGNHIEAFANSAISPSLFPGRSDLCLQYSRLGARAVGESCVGGELYAICPSVFFKLYHPLSATRTPSLQWVGGQVYDLRKPKGPPLHGEVYRDITICDVDQKPFSILSGPVSSLLWIVAPPPISLVVAATMGLPRSPM